MEDFGRFTGKWKKYFKDKGDRGTVLLSPSEPDDYDLNG